MNEVRKPSDSECYTPSSEPFRFHSKEHIPNFSVLYESISVYSNLKVLF
jgi:hypothetical protein